MKKRRTKVVIGVLLIIAGFYLMKTSAYTSIKGVTMEYSSNIGLAVAVAMGIIALAFATGVTLLRKA